MIWLSIRLLLLKSSLSPSWTPLNPITNFSSFKVIPSLSQFWVLLIKQLLFFTTWFYNISCLGIILWFEWSVVKVFEVIIIGFPVVSRLTKFTPFLGYSFSFMIVVNLSFICTELNCNFLICKNDIFCDFLRSLPLQNFDF